MKWIIVIMIGLILFASLTTRHDMTTIVYRSNNQGNGTYSPYSVPPVISVPILEIDCIQDNSIGWICHHVEAGEYTELPLVTPRSGDIIIGPGRNWWVTCSSFSMYPTVWCAGTYVGRYSGNIQDGDIIWFSTENNTNDILHRVNSTHVDNEGIYYLTKGDNNNYIDSWKVRNTDIRLKIIGRYAG